MVGGLFVGKEGLNARSVEKTDKVCLIFPTSATNPKTGPEFPNDNEGYVNLISILQDLNGLFIAAAEINIAIRVNGYSHDQTLGSI